MALGKRVGLLQGVAEVLGGAEVTAGLAVAVPPRRRLPEAVMLGLTDGVKTAEVARGLGLAELVVEELREAKGVAVGERLGVPLREFLPGRLGVAPLLPEAVWEGEMLLLRVPGAEVAKEVPVAHTVGVEEKMLGEVDGDTVGVAVQDLPISRSVVPPVAPAAPEGDQPGLEASEGSVPEAMLVK